VLDIQIILDRLEKVRKSGKGYMACCPVHEDRSPSMGIEEKDNKILCHCFGCGAKGIEIVAALNLPPDVLFHDPLERIEDKHHQLNKKSDWDDFMLMMASDTLKQGKLLRHKDYKEVKQSLARREQRRLFGLPILSNMEIVL
tara:strand:+ start:8350 stop:8775 length:426 start_codon:yes stop_codon:yes gene_type:complete